MKIKWRPKEKDIEFRKVYNPGNFSIEILRNELYNFFNRDATRAVKITMYEDKVGGERGLPEEEKGT